MGRYEVGQRVIVLLHGLHPSAGVGYEAAGTIVVAEADDTYTVCVDTPVGAQVEFRSVGVSRIEPA
jgi:hypothetical protein